MKLWSRLIAWANRPSLEEQLGAECNGILLKLETANTHILDLRRQNQQLRELLRGPAPGSIELTLRTTARDGTPLSMQYQMTGIEQARSSEATADILGHRCRTLALAMMQQTE